MAAVPVTIIGTITTRAPKGGEVDQSGIEQCVIQGIASITGLEIGGGPIYPPQQPPSGGGAPPQPIHPIWGPPGFNPPGEGMPPGIWGGPIIPPGGGEKPPDLTPSPPDMAVKPPPSGGGWAYVEPWGWGFFPGSGQAGPK